VAETAASPLSGKRVVITRAVAQSSELFETLRAGGALPVSLPLISFAPPQDFTPVDAALQQLDRFDWAIFTSVNVVHALAARSGTLGRDLHNLGKPPRIAVVGPATKQEAELAGLRVHYVARTHLGVALAEELGEQLRNKTVLLPRSDRANPDLPAALRRFGAQLTEVVAYRTLPPSDIDRDRVVRIVAGPGEPEAADAIVFFSPSAVHTLASLLGRHQLAAAQNTVVIAAVGPVTAAALRECGVHRMVVAADTTSAAAVAALEAHFAAALKQPQPSPHQSPAGAECG
jgi:uroporphyrinogen III methyltransferase/synthase